MTTQQAATVMFDHYCTALPSLPRLTQFQPLMLNYSVEEKQSDLAFQKPRVLIMLDLRLRETQQFWSDLIDSTVLRQTQDGGVNYSMSHSLLFRQTQSGSVLSESRMLDKRWTSLWNTCLPVSTIDAMILSLIAHSFCRRTCGLLASSKTT